MGKVLLQFLKGTPGKVCLLAVLYFLTGKIGLMLSVPPGYATIVWPPSGIAAGMVIVYGWRLWPGILIGSFLLNIHISEAVTLASADALKVSAAFGIAVGSTLQVLATRWLIERYVGLPLSLKQGWDVLRLYVLSGPVACLIAATVAIASLIFSGVMPAERAAENWLTWWTGDMIGILIFMPLVVIAPWSAGGVQWQGKSMGSLSLTAIAVLALSLGMTFFAWKVVTEKGYEHNLEEFTMLAGEHEKALLHKIDSYDHALLGGVGFFLGSDYVDREEWRTYVKAIDIGNSFPGIGGIGWIKPVENKEIPSFLETMRKEVKPDFNIHPDTKGRPNYIIAYIEPSERNEAALGLNIGFEESRTEAAEKSRDTGEAVITSRITLVQDKEQTPGFLLLHPMYRPDAPTASVEQRREAFKGWIYAPFIAKDFLKNLTGSQGKTINVRIYDGNEENPQNLIYSSSAKIDLDPSYVVRKNLKILQQEWLIVWQSTAAYEHMEKSDSPLFILVGGLTLSGLLALFFIISMMRQVETARWATEEGKLLLPIIIFAIVSGASLHLYETLKNRELKYIETIVDEESKKIEQMVAFQVQDKLLSLRRVGERWNVANGTPLAQWRLDARNLVHDITGLKTLEWIGSDYRIRWAEPEAGNEKAIGLDILFDETREKALKGAADKDAITITPPIDLVQGYKAFIAYSPVFKGKDFDGFMAGIFSINEFLETVLTDELSEKYAISLDYQGDEFFRVGPEEEKLKSSWERKKNIQVYDQSWKVTIVPLEKFISGLTSSMPMVIFIASLLIAALLSITVHHILVSRVRSARLQNSEETFRSAMQHAPIGMAMVNLSGRFMEVNQSLCNLLGYSREELLLTDFQTLTHPDDLDEDLGYMSRVLLDQSQAYQMEKRYFHKSGRLVWALLSVSLVRDLGRHPKYYISQIQDISEQREMERMKNEFISIVSHELRTPLTSIRGSLGLIEGTMLKDIPEKAAKLITLAHKNVERLILLINDILDLDKLASGQMRFNLKRENLAALLNQAIESNQAYADRFKVRFKLSEPVDDSVFVRTDPNRLAQIFANLLSNAAKYSPEGKSVLIKALPSASKVRVSVTDMGPGIDKAFQAHIFEKFSQADSSITREKGGTGLGLHISKEMIEKMHGGIGFYIEEGEGTTFWVDIPLDKADGSTGRAASSRKESVNIISGKNKHPPAQQFLKVLHVEDDEDFHRLLSAALEDRVHLFHVSSLEEATAVLSQDDFSLIVLDIALPDASGLELLNVIHRLPDGRAPVIILSAHEAPEYVGDKVLACLIKSRIPESEIIRTIEFYINTMQEGPAP